MVFNDLNLNERFRFHTFSQEIWRKVSDTQCICLTYKDSEVDKPYSVSQKVYPIIERTDKFQPMSLVKALREKMKEVSDNITIDKTMKDGIHLGLTWAISEITRQATARDRFTMWCPGICVDNND